MIDFLKHLRIDVPTLAESQITFYGGFGYFMFILINILTIIGAITILKKLFKLVGSIKK